MTMEETIKKIKPLDGASMAACKHYINTLAKPIYGLGNLEDLWIQFAGIMGTDQVDIKKKALIIMCADNGVVEEGISQADASVTAIVANRFHTGQTTASIMSRRAGVDVFPIDIGIKVDTMIPTKKVAYGTKNIAKGPAMSMEEVKKAITIGIKQAQTCKEKGYRLLATGEMGIGNTTTSSAVAAVLLGVSVESVTGTGAGLSNQQFSRKCQVLKQAIEINKPNPKDPLEVLAKVGGLDIAGLVGVFLGGAALGIPIMIDGFISAVAALIASKLEPLIRSYAIPSHSSREPGMKQVLEALFMNPSIYCNMSLGEGTGAIAFMPLLDMMQAVYEEMVTFEEIAIPAYEIYTCNGAMNEES